MLYRTPKANILRSEAIKDSSAPIVGSFSSRGPNSIFPDILKVLQTAVCGNLFSTFSSQNMYVFSQYCSTMQPDISAPGIDILAAYSPVASPSENPDLDARSVEYNILSGTSMACPHVTGAAAYVKSLHPNWSPSAIKSAVMTTGTNYVMT